MPVSANSKGYLSSTIADTAGTILALADGGAAELPSGAQSFVGRLETAQIRGRADGTAPTTTEGEVVDIGMVMYLSESDITRMNFIRTGGTSGVIKGHFYDATVNQLLGKGA